MLRNKEFKQFVLLLLCMSTLFVIIGFVINSSTGVLMIVAVTCFGTAFYLFTKKRYESIAKLSEQIDVVLHNADQLFLDDADEGELSILQSEITKMTLRIREQNHALQREKQHLADSLADIAHQLRTPLTSLNLILSLLANTPDEEEQKALIREMEELLLRMDWLITSLLKLSRLDAGIVVFEREEIKVKTLIDSALRPLLIPMELHGIQIQITATTDVTLQGDMGWLSEALQNILKNCMESTGDNGEIHITCADNPLFTEISIHDNGAGFQPDEIPFLFDRFSRGKGRNATGYGIGLALCRGIITRHGGTITAKNHPKGGALFSIRFPK